MGRKKGSKQRYIQEIKKYHSLGKSSSEIAELIGIKKATVQHYAWEVGLIFDISHKPIKEEEREKIKFMYTEQGKTADEIAKELGKYKYTIVKHLKSMGFDDVAKTYDSDGKAYPMAIFKPIVLEGIPVVYEQHLYFDVSRFPVYGIESPNRVKIPKWKLKQQRLFDTTNGRKGVNYGDYIRKAM